MHVHKMMLWIFQISVLVALWKKFCIISIPAGLFFCMQDNCFSLFFGYIYDSNEIQKGRMVSLPYAPALFIPHNIHNRGKTLLPKRMLNCFKVYPCFHI